MKYLVISTLPHNNEETAKFVHDLSATGVEVTVMYGEDYHIEGCRGCTACWLKTPGKCILNDDYEIIFQEILQSDILVLVTETKLGFISYKLKNIMDRILPIVTPYIEIRNGACRHIPRYSSVPHIALMYTGERDNQFLNEWMNCVAENLHSVSLGAYHSQEQEVLIHAINHI